tara:strand:+ start:1030 stop:1977 length:948 start_codon:yes stop_codon:yes gene_type:complete
MIIENQFLIGDNLEIMSSLADESVDLVYMDPPYNSGRDFGEFQDKFPSMYEYSQKFLLPRFEEIHRVLTKNGNLVVHIEPKNSHHVRVAIEDVFGEKNFRNEIVWKSGGNAKNKKQLGRYHDTLLVYSKTKAPTYNPIYLPYDDKYKKKSSVKVCPTTDRQYVTTAIHNSQPDVNPRMNLRYEWNGHSRQWYVSLEKMKKLHDDDRLQYNQRGVPRIKRFLDEMDGIPVRDLWTDINQIQGWEKLSYPTQKPVRLLERVIQLYSNEEELVLDPFAGSGTAAHAAILHNRKYLMIDINENGKTEFLKRRTDKKDKR